MRHLYRFRLKALLGDRANMFWTLAFPLLLALFFNLVFGSTLERTERFDPIPVAIVGQSRLADALDGGEWLIITRTDEAEALRLLEDEEVAGVLLADPDPRLVFKTDGMEQSILKTIVDSALQIGATAEEIAVLDPARAAAALERLTGSASVIRPVSLSGGSLDHLLQMFYALIPMTCLCGGFFGLNCALAVQPALSPLGARRGVTPTPKSKLVLADMLASVTILFASVGLLLAFIRFVLGVQLGRHWPAMLLIALLGSSIGTLLGMLIGAALPVSKGLKEGIMIGLALLFSFLSGLVYSNTRALIESVFPLFNRINPAALMVDSFYALDAYGIGPRFWGNMGLLLVMTAVLFTGCTLFLRRKQYASL